LREEAFAMRLDRKSFADIARALSVTTKTVSRWENGYTDSSGHTHKGWKPRLEMAWKKFTETRLQHDLMEKEECLKAIEELARMLFNRLKEFLPSVKLRNAADAKSLMSELRELVRLAAQKKGEFMKSPDSIVAVKADISFGELQERYAAAKAREAEFKTFQPAPQSGASRQAGQEGEANDGSDSKEGCGAEGSPRVADDN